MSVIRTPGSDPRFPPPGSAEAEGGHVTNGTGRRPAPKPKTRSGNSVEERVTTWSDEDYPARLTTIPDPPPVLYLRGTLLPRDERALAMVGTRRPTLYGRDVAERLARDLAAAGLTVVSGLAVASTATCYAPSAFWSVSARRRSASPVGVQVTSTS